MTEKRATYRCAPNRATFPGPALGGGLFVAGDYTHARLPATLEAAVASGVTAAGALLAEPR